MSEAQQRIPSLPEEQWTPEVNDFLDFMGEPGRHYNFTHWFANHPRLAKSWITYNRNLAAGILPKQLREIVILRVALLQKSEFEWVEHVRIGTRIGLDESHFDAIKKGADAPKWDARERLCLQAVDQLCATQDIDDKLWARLSQALTIQELMELLFVVGSYTLLATVLRTVRIPLQDKGVAVGAIDHS